MKIAFLDLSSWTATEQAVLSDADLFVKLATFRVSMAPLDNLPLNIASFHTDLRKGCTIKLKNTISRIKTKFCRKRIQKHIKKKWPAPN